MPGNARGHQKLRKEGAVSQGWFIQRDQDLRTTVSRMSGLLGPPAYCADTWNEGPLRVLLYQISLPVAVIQPVEFLVLPP